MCDLYFCLPGKVQVEITLRKTIYKSYRGQRQNLADKVLTCMWLTKIHPQSTARSNPCMQSQDQALSSSKRGPKQNPKQNNQKLRIVFM